LILIILTILPIFTLLRSNRPPYLYKQDQIEIGET
jgi:hypothetical protein